ncbi:MAG: hypothetical protein JJE28_10740, partial [Actinomycetales bacterium]|nr:hypothetical protein [Actinomycetales bacterium]
MSTRPNTPPDARLHFFSGELPRILAHRGLAQNADENTIAAFGAAFGAGAQILETDVRATADGVAVLIHDAFLANGMRVQDLTLKELQAVELPRGGTVPTLLEALVSFSEAKFNIDLKSSDAVVPTAEAITNALAIDRVLVASFSRSRQRRAVKLLPGVATSASSLIVLGAVVAGKLRWVALMRFILHCELAVRVLSKGTLPRSRVLSFIRQQRRSYMAQKSLRGIRLGS